MTTDKVFILLLVILLPLTGCLDMTDNADASDPVDTPTMAETTPEIFSLHIAANANYTVNFDGNTTLKIETIYLWSANGYWEPTQNYYVFDFNMTCGNINISPVVLFQGSYLPVLGGQECSITFNPTKEVFMFFSEATLGSL